MHEDFASQAKSLVADAKSCLGQDRENILETIEALGQISLWKVYGYWRCTQAEFAVKVLGLSPKAYWMRVNAFKAFRLCPELKTMVAEGETTVSVVALLYGKLTPANVTLLVNGIRNKSKKEAEGFIVRVSCHGEVREPEEAVMRAIDGFLDRRDQEQWANGGQPGLKTSSPDSPSRHQRLSGDD